ncbi:MAG: EVE domain-containing protein [Allosphingosinicella sp.]
MAYWLVKSEPGAWSWQQQVDAGTTHWDGVRNHQAVNNLKAMRVGDRVMFYHSGETREIVGIVEVTRTYHADPNDPTGRFGMVDVRTVAPLPRPVTLAAIKGEPRLQNLALVRQSRLPVVPIDDDAWALLCAMGGFQA